MPLRAAPLPAPDPPAATHSARLTAKLATQIEQAGGWIDFTSFMSTALYAPGLGYYAAGSMKLGAGGDFVTAPELSPLFSRTLARQVAEVLAATGGDVLELGPGSGRMAADLLRALAELNCLPQRYLLLDVSADLRERQHRLLSTLPDALRPRVSWVDRLPEQHIGIVLANEVFDALPVALVVWHKAEVLERGVICRDGKFAWEDRTVPAGRLLDAAQRIRAAHPNIGQGAAYLSEVGLAARDLMRALARALSRGVVLAIDYGFGAAEYYHPQRDRGTLMCHYRHHAHDDPFLWPGLQDITAHVDFTALATAGVEAGMGMLGYTSQARFLVNLGITEVLSHLPVDDAAVYAPAAAAVQKLLSPAEMGELFKVLALGRGLPQPLSGFASGDLSRLL